MSSTVLPGPSGRGTSPTASRAKQRVARSRSALRTTTSGRQFVYALRERSGSQVPDVVAAPVLQLEGETPDTQLELMRQLTDSLIGLVFERRAAVLRKSEHLASEGLEREAARQRLGQLLEELSTLRSTAPMLDALSRNDLERLASLGVLPNIAAPATLAPLDAGARRGRTVAALDGSTRGWDLPALAADPAVPERMGQGSRLLAPATGGLQAAKKRGEQARLAWISEGYVIDAKALGDSWGVTPQALSSAEKKERLFSVVIKRQRYYPSEFLILVRADIEPVNEALASSAPMGRGTGLSPEDKMTFWKKPHGALRGRTVAQALARGERDRVVALARRWANEG